MKSHTPRVSVLTPIYNTNPTHLRECIESVLAQTFTDFEFLILNDSPDNMEIEKIVKEYAKRDKRIKYFKNDRNMGITPSRNKLLDMARGEYIATFDHDDISVPNRLELQVDFLDKNPNVGVVSGLMEYFGEKNYIRQYPEYDADIKMYMTDNCSVSHTASMMRKSVLDENDIRYESYFSPGEDYRLFARLMEHTLFYNMQIPLVRYRFFAGQTTHTQAAKMARAHHFISTLSDGYDTVLDENGTNISQGQRQLITIARAVLANPSILILDEATSSVDTRTEMQIQYAMADLMKNRTCFVIAHRLSTIRKADTILVIDNGEIVEAGNHEELLAKKGFYYQLYNS
jgi:glycosyltransferase involved in cell wall biosynthesis